VTKFDHILSSQEDASYASFMARLIGELFHELFMSMVVPWTQQENQDGWPLARFALFYG